jgi:hypothetical protein
MKKFNSTSNKGFNMTFANGITASVQWGAGNYCDNHFSKDFSSQKKQVLIQQKWPHGMKTTNGLQISSATPVMMLLGISPQMKCCSF